MPMNSAQLAELVIRARHKAPPDAARRILSPAVADPAPQGSTSLGGLLARHAPRQQPLAAGPCHPLAADHHPTQGLAAAGPIVGMPTTRGGPTASACPTGECRYMMLLAAIAAWSLLAFGFLLFVVQLVAHEIGFWIGRRRAGGGNIASEGVGVLVTGTGRRMPPRRLS